MSSGAMAQDPTGEQKPVIEAIARFAQPIGHLNKLGVKVPGEFLISIKRKSGKATVWRAYWHEARRPFENAQGEELSSEMYLTLKAEIETYFETKVTDWQEFT